MSGIFGFSYLRADAEQQLLTDTLDTLEYWNRIYGREAHAKELLSNGGIGCRIEHFSDKFPYGGPILDQDGCPAVVDALLYNRDELIEQLHLDASDHPLSDEALLLHWIEVKGFEALAQVNGDFAGAIFDPKTGEWILFRDHLGVRPLYYYLDETLFGFSTDLRALAAMPDADTGIDEMEFFIRACGTNPLTMQRTDFAFIRCILPGAVTRVKRTSQGFKLTEEVYWTPHQKKIRLSTDEAYRQELRRLITDAVNRRCDAIPGLLGGELSGGLDSSVIDILVCRHGRKAKFYSWSWDLDTLSMVEGEDERKTIQAICEREQTECHYMNKDERISLEGAGEHLYPPFLTTQTLGYGSAWLRSQGARVVFTGHGGDEGVSHRGRRYELFFCKEYWTYFKYYWKDLAGKPLRLPRSLRAGWIDAMADHRKTRESASQIPSHLEAFPADFRDRMLDRYVPQPFTFNYAPHIYVNQGGTRPRMDNAAYQGAVHGMRYLFPYVDYRVMDYALSIPRRLYVGQKMSRMIFRDAFRDILPASLYLKNYKYQASTHHLSDDNPPEIYRQYVYKMLSHLDRNAWGKYLDFEKLEAMLLSSDGKAGGIGSLDTLSEYMYRCTLIQNIQQNAKRWREFDEQDKTV